MIDFPASPTDGQIFSATNGVVYKWSATYSSWLAQNPAPPLGGTGAVQAVSGTFNPVLNTDALITFLTVASGNEGGWYSTATGRYTPPAGRYFIQCTNGVQAPSGGNGTWSLIPRKNGVRIPNEGASASGAASFSVPITVGCYVDANGSDYFDWVANTNATGMAAQGGVFTAFPLTGMQGPTGPVNSGGQIIRDITLAAPAPTIDLFNLGPTYRTIKVLYRLTPVTDAVGVYLRGVNGSTPDLSSNYYSLMMYGFGASSVGYVPQSAVSAFIFTTSQSNIAGTATAGSIEFPDLAGAVGEAAYYYAQGGGGTPVTAKTTCLKLASAAHNGLQFSLSAGNFAAGSYARVIGWP